MSKKKLEEFSVSVKRRDLASALRKLGGLFPDEFDQEEVEAIEESASMLSVSEDDSSELDPAEAAELARRIDAGEVDPSVLEEIMGVSGLGQSYHVKKDGQKGDLELEIILGPKKQIVLRFSSAPRIIAGIRAVLTQEKRGGSRPSKKTKASQPRSSERQRKRRGESDGRYE